MICPWSLYEKQLLSRSGRNNQDYLDVSARYLSIWKKHAWIQYDSVSTSMRESLKALLKDTVKPYRSVCHRSPRSGTRVPPISITFEEAYEKAALPHHLKGKDRSVKFKPTGPAPQLNIFMVCGSAASYPVEEERDS